MLVTLRRSLSTSAVLLRRSRGRPSVSDRSPPPAAAAAQVYSFAAFSVPDARGGWPKALADNARRSGLAGPAADMRVAAQAALDDLVQRVVQQQAESGDSAERAAPAPPLLHHGLQQLVYNVLGANRVKVLKQVPLQDLAEVIAEGCVETGMARRNADGSLAFLGEEAAIRAMVEIGAAAEEDRGHNLSVGGEAEQEKEERVEEQAAAVQEEEEDEEQPMQAAGSDANQDEEVIAEDDDDEERVEYPAAASKIARPPQAVLDDALEYVLKDMKLKQTHKARDEDDSDDEEEDSEDNDLDYPGHPDARKLQHDREAEERYQASIASDAPKLKEVPFALGKMPNEKLRKRESWRHSVRHSRVSSAMVEALHEIFYTAPFTRDFLFADVYVDDVSMTPNLRTAFVYWSTERTGLDEKLSQSFEFHSKTIRRLVSKRLNMKYAPQLRFVRSYQDQHMRYMDTLFAKMQQEIKEYDQKLEAGKSKAS